MSRSLPIRALLLAPLAVLIVTDTASANPPRDDHRQQIELHSWSMPTPTAASPRLFLHVCDGEHIAREVNPSDLPAMKSLD